MARRRRVGSNWTKINTFVTFSRPGMEYPTPKELVDVRAKLTKWSFDATLTACGHDLENFDKYAKPEVEHERRCRVMRAIVDACRRDADDHLRRVDMINQLIDGIARYFGMEPLPDPPVRGCTIGCSRIVM